MNSVRKSVKKSIFENPLIVDVNGKEFSLDGETHEGFDELQRYLADIIRPQKDEVYHYCDQNYESLGMYWNEVEDNLKEDYRYWVDVIAEYFSQSVWNSCFAGGNMDWNEYFGIRAKHVDGGYKGSAKKMKKSIVDDMQMHDGMINVSRGGGDNGNNYTLLEYEDILEESDDEDAIDSLHEKIESGQERFTIHRNNGWDYDITVLKSAKKLKKSADGIGLTLLEFLKEYKQGRLLSNFEAYAVESINNPNGNYIGTSYFDIPHEYADCKVVGYYAEDMIDYAMLVIQIDDSNVAKSYTPDYAEFRDMVEGIRKTGNHNNVFKR